MEKTVPSFNFINVKYDPEVKFLQLTHLLPVGVYSTDKDGVLTFYNESAARIWGRNPQPNSKEEIPFSGSKKIYDADGELIPLNESPLAKVLHSKTKIQDEELIIEQPDGHRVTILLNVEPLFDNNHILTGTISVFQDISEKKHTEIGMRRLAAIVESSDDAIISKTLKGIITSWNRAAEKMFGYKEDEIIGKSIEILIPLSNRQEEKEIISRIKSGQKIEHFETIRVRKDGTEINISLAVSPLKNDKGEIVGASKIARDITKRVELDNKLCIYREQLEELNNYKDEFMAMASHELKTPLTVIKANLQLLEFKLLQDPNYEFVNKTMKQVNKLGNLIADLFDISKIQAGQLQLNYSEFDLKDLVEETIGSISHTFVSHKIKTVNGPSIKIAADYQRLEQVLINILTNAIKYSPDAHEIIINTSSDKENAIISVTDFGIGIPSDDIEKVFTRFFRARGLASTFSGSGIGLYISSEIIKRHGGKMWVESKENIGSVFYCSLPLVQQKSTA
jgi:PAS domain S-box-containing protein